MPYPSPSDEPLWPFVLACVEVLVFFALVVALAVMGVMSWAW